MHRQGITLMELLIVVIIIGILATLGKLSYTGIKEDALDKEARSNLRLILAAERIYRLEVGGYYQGGSTADINDYLRLVLPTANPNWNYTTTANGAASSCSQATRTEGGRTWRFNTTDPNPVAGVTCP